VKKNAEIVCKIVVLILFSFANIALLIFGTEWDITTMLRLRVIFAEETVLTIYKLYGGNVISS